jgi:hypothetical protein
LHSKKIVTIDLGVAQRDLINRVTRDPRLSPGGPPQIETSKERRRSLISPPEFPFTASTTERKRLERRLRTNIAMECIEWLIGREIATQRAVAEAAQRELERAQRRAKIERQFPNITVL